MSTGIYIRVRREEKYENLEIDHCTEEELQEHFSKLDKWQAVHWLFCALDILNAQIGQLSSGAKQEESV